MTGATTFFLFAKLKFQCKQCTPYHWSARYSIYTKIDNVNKLEDF